MKAATVCRVSSCLARATACAVAGGRIGVVLADTRGLGSMRLHARHEPAAQRRPHDRRLALSFGKKPCDRLRVRIGATQVTAEIPHLRVKAP